MAHDTYIYTKARRAFKTPTPDQFQQILRHDLASHYSGSVFAFVENPRITSRYKVSLACVDTTYPTTRTRRVGQVWE